MAVAFVIDASGLGSAQSPTFNITVSGTNPVLLVDVGLDSTTATVSSVSWSLGSGTPAEVKNVRSGTAFATVFAIPAPVAGAGTVTVNKSTTSINHQIDVACFSGADQTNPCPAGDAVADALDGGTLTPAHLAAGDATNGCAVNTIAGNPVGVSPNSRYVNTTTSVNIEAGDATGTTGLTYTTNGGGATVAKVAVRIQTPTTTSNQLMWVKG
jgi:hypothetical protein